MKAYIKVEYVNVGDFWLETDFLRSQVEEIMAHGRLNRRLLGDDYSIQAQPVVLDEQLDHSEVITLESRKFGYSPILPGPKIFRDHMKSYNRNGWFLVSGSESGAFEALPSYARAIKGVSLLQSLKNTVFSIIKTRAA